MKKFRDFESARKFVRSLGLKNQKEWKEYCKSGNKPDDIPSHSERTYKNKGWQGWGDFTGTGRVANRNKIYRSFKESREFVRKLNLKTVEEWREYRMSSNKPDDIPSTPEYIYKNKGWKGWGDFTGTGTIASQDKVYRSFKEAREFVGMLGLKNKNEWYDYCKSGNKPDDIPANPWQVYKEWKKK